MMGKLLSLKPAGRDPYRAALAVAIEEEAVAARNLRAATDAAQRAAEQAFDAKTKLEHVRLENARPKSYQGLAEAFIASVADGSPCNVVALDRPPGADKSLEDTLVHEFDIWTKTRASCEAMIKIRQDEFNKAAGRVTEAARDVVRNSNELQKLITGFPELYQEIERRRAALTAILLNGMAGESDRDLIRSCINRGFVAADSHPAREAWTKTLEALKRDADAPLPL